MLRLYLEHFFAVAGGARCLLTDLFGLEGSCGSRSRVSLENRAPGHVRSPDVVADRGVSTASGCRGRPSSCSRCSSPWSSSGSCWAARGRRGKASSWSWIPWYEYWCEKQLPPACIPLHRVASWAASHVHSQRPRVVRPKGCAGTTQGRSRDLIVFTARTSFLYGLEDVRPTPLRFPRCPGCFGESSNTWPRPNRS